MVKKLFAIALCFCLLIPFAAPALASDDVIGGKSYTIESPYATVDWENWDHYKANLHTHTTYSDGERLLSEVVEDYYRMNYDILAITDHGVLGTKWNEKAETMPIIGYNALIGKLDCLTDERYTAITTGSDRDGRGMLNVTQGIELNAVVVNKNHVNGFFCDYGSNVWGTEHDYETVIKGNAEAGGLSFFNHLGDWTRADDDASINSDPKIVQFFADILIKYPSCLGLEIINSGDGDTKNDRILWDNLLQVVLPTGRNVFAFADDDSHSTGDCFKSFEMFLLPENTETALRTGMENGTFFACGRRVMLELGEDCDVDVNVPTIPTVTDIDIDEDTDQITVTGENYDTIEWVSNGKIIASGNQIDLNAYENDITSYVRFQMHGEGGYCFSQPFVCDDGTLSEQNSQIYTPPVYSDAMQSLIDLYNLFHNSLIGAALETLYDKVVNDRG